MNIHNLQQTLDSLVILMLDLVIIIDIIRDDSAVQCTRTKAKTA
jgi:hypothetical protein